MICMVSEYKELFSKMAMTYINKLMIWIRILMIELYKEDQEVIANMQKTMLI